MTNLIKIVFLVFLLSLTGQTFSQTKRELRDRNELIYQQLDSLSTIFCDSTSTLIILGDWTVVQIAKSEFAVQNKRNKISLIFKEKKMIILDVGRHDFLKNTFCNEVLTSIEEELKRGASIVRKVSHPNIYMAVRVDLDILPVSFCDLAKLMYGEMLGEIEVTGVTKNYYSFEKDGCRLDLAVDGRTNVVSVVSISNYGANCYIGELNPDIRADFVADLKAQLKIRF